MADGSRLIARVARAQWSKTLERRAINTLNHIKASNAKCQVPRVYWDNLDQPGETPAIILEDCIEGRSLSVWNSAIPKEQQDAFLDSLAQFLLDLWNIEAPKDASVTPAVMTYSGWLEAEIDKAIRRCMNGSAKWGKASDYLVMRSMIPQIAQNLDVFDTIGIAHGDMNAHNFIVNERLELMGVVDWDWTFEAPLPAVVQYPWFLADVPGWHNDGVEIGESFEHNRDYLIKALSVKEKASSKADTVSTLLAQASRRQIFQSAISYKDIHKEFVKSDLVFLQAKTHNVRPQLEVFLARYPEHKGCSVAKQVMLSDQVDCI